MVIPMIRSVQCTVSVVILTLCHLVSGQNETLEATVNDAFLQSPNYTGNYAPNLTYDYLVQTTYPNHTIGLTVIDCEIENGTDKDGNCLYDFLEIFDGTNATALKLATFCCPDSNPYQSFASTGDVVYLKFVTDKGKQFRGFRIKYSSDGITTTTASTSTASAASVSSSGSLNIWIIVGCVIGGLVLIAIVIAVCCFYSKSKRPDTTDSNSKRILWRRNTTVQPFEHSTSNNVPGVIQTDIFDFDLPPADCGRANQLPPLSSKLEPRKLASPVIVPDEADFKMKNIDNMEY